MDSTRSAELEQQAQNLAARIHGKVDEIILSIARQLLQVPDERLFGETEIQLRDLVLQIIPNAYQQLFLEKKSG
jgi:DNA polymerase sigma